MTKKNIFEKLGFIEQSNEEELEVKDEAKKDHEFDLLSKLESEESINIPEPKNMPDLSKIEEKKEEVKAEVKPEVVAKEVATSESTEIEEKLDYLIGAYEKNKLMTIDEIYRNARLQTDIKRTIFMADTYLKALPENLPIDIKRQSVLDIMEVSNISKEDLLKDAYQRIDSLNTVLEETVQTSDEIMKRHETNIRELEKRIEDLKGIVQDRVKFQEDQNTMIEYEIQKIINIVEFIKPKK